MTERIEWIPVNRWASGLKKIISTFNQSILDLPDQVPLPREFRWVEDDDPIWLVRAMEVREDGSGPSYWLGVFGDGDVSRSPSVQLSKEMFPERPTTMPVVWEPMLDMQGKLFMVPRLSDVARASLFVEGYFPELRMLGIGTIKVRRLLDMPVIASAVTKDARFPKSLWGTDEDVYTFEEELRTYLASRPKRPTF